MKIHAARPARAACAATALARLPVDAQPTVSRPKAPRGVERDGDDAVLEGEGRVGDRVVLHERAPDAERPRERGRVEERGEAGVGRDDRRVESGSHSR